MPLDRLRSDFDPGTSPDFKAYVIQLRVHHHGNYRSLKRAADPLPRPQNAHVGKPDTRRRVLWRAIRAAVAPRSVKKCETASRSRSRRRRAPPVAPPGLMAQVPIQPIPRGGLPTTPYRWEAASVQAVRHGKPLACSTVIARPLRTYPRRALTRATDPLPRPPPAHVGKLATRGASGIGAVAGR